LLLDAPVTIGLQTEPAGASTRTPYDITTPTATQPLKAYVLGSTTQGDYTSPYLCDWVEWTSGHATTFEGGTVSYQYPAEDSPLYLIGLYPYTHATTGAGWSQTTAGTPSAAGEGNRFVGIIDGKTDLMVADEVHHTASEAIASPASLEFRHLGTKLTLCLKANSQTAIDYWGKVTGLTLAHAGHGSTTTPATQATVEIADKDATTISWGTPAEAPLPFYAYNGTTYNDATPLSSGASLPLSTTATPVGYIIAPAITPAGDADYVIRVTTEKYTDGIDVNIDIPTGTTTMGMAYSLTLNFNKTKLLIALEAFGTIHWKPFEPAGGRPTEDVELPSGTWATSNIYWKPDANDPTQGILTFDKPGLAPPRQDKMYQGLYFPWGSLIGIAPVDGMNTLTGVIYVPAKTPGRTYRKSTMGDEGYTNIVPCGYQNSNQPIDESGELEESTVNGATAYSGDICAYITQGEWRLPKTWDFGQYNGNVVNYVDESNPATKLAGWIKSTSWDESKIVESGDPAAGTYIKMPQNYCTQTKYVIDPSIKLVSLPAGGAYSNLNTDIGKAGAYWTAFPQGSNLFNATLFYFSNLSASTQNCDKTFYTPIRCVKK
jgi:hypothetical protein